jgi:hypothetical protein
MCPVVNVTHVPACRVSAARGPRRRETLTNSLTLTLTPTRPGLR